MSLRNVFIGSLTLLSCAAGFASPTSDAMRSAAAVQTNTKYSSILSLTKDADLNIISFHVNGVNPTDAEILLTKDPSPLSTEFTVVSGVTKEGWTSFYMLPTNIATPHIIESISRDLVNAGAISVQIAKQLTGR